MTKLVSARVLPCKCGGDPVVKGDQRMCMTWLECGRCGRRTSFYARRSMAIEAWNMRVVPESGGIPCTEENMEAHGWVRERTCEEAKIDRFFRGCSVCGYMWEYMYGIGKRTCPNYCPNCGARVVND